MGCCENSSPKKSFMSDQFLFLEQIFNSKADPESDFYKKKKVIEDLREELGDKANYHAVTERMKETAGLMDIGSTSEEMGWYLLTLMEAIDCMSMEIYEHYRTLVDLLKELVRGYVCLDSFDANTMLQQSPRFAAMLGCVIAKACECNCLNAEKYEHIGCELTGGMIPKETHDN